MATDFLQMMSATGGGDVTSSSSSSLIPGLPDDVAVNIIARIPRSHHPGLTLVSRPFRSLLSSPLLFSTRRLIPSTHPSLYLSLRLPSSLLWFSLHSPDRRFSPIPPIPSPPLAGSAFASLGSFIFALCGSLPNLSSPSPSVWSLDCRFHLWSPSPPSRIPREFPAAACADGKLYLLGGCSPDTRARCSNWAEVFDPVSGKWEAVPSLPEVRDKWMHASATIDGRVYAMGDRGGVMYDARKRTWENVCGELDNGWRGRACVVGGVLYCYDYLGKIRGFDFEAGMWKELKGVGKGLPRFLRGATLVDFGGNLVVVWEENDGGGSCKGKGMEIWCAEIRVRQDETCRDLVGEICWSGCALSVPVRASIVCCLAVEL
ncbi:hypothetical protein MLD38_040075 [Melastoma candidum]|uniref:Uncharacterized protein n=1 Tax=Melastoma candidum TaxID=119954 RepID=A0ACB9L6F2_9MYRT|nr:hypothetical protein MLD38_040075 [Melastoma candidum]